MHAQALQPDPTKLSGFSFGFIKCSAPFGNGVQSSTYHATVNPKTGAATDRGSYKNWFVSQARRAEAFLITWLELSGLLEPALAAAGREHPR